MTIITILTVHHSNTNKSTHESTNASKQEHTDTRHHNNTELSQHPEKFATMSILKNNSRSIFFYTLYGLSSICMTIFNKKIIEEYNYPRILLIAQNIASVLFILIGANVVSTYINKQTKDTSLLSKGNVSMLELLASYLRMNPFEMIHLLYCVPITVTYLFMLLSSLKALSLVSVATVVVFRNVATLLVAIGDYFFFQKDFSIKQIFALLIIAVGALIYSYNDFQANSEGYLWVGLNTLSVVLNSLIEKFVTVNISQSAVGISCYQNMLSTLILIVFVTLQNAWGSSLGDLISISSEAKLMFLLTCVFGTTIGIAYFSLNKFESPTSITVAGNMNKFLSVVVSYFVFKTGFNIESLVGLSICIIGGLYYSIASIQR